MGIGLVLLLLIVLIAYFHVGQGIFSALISAIIAVVSASLAVSFHEPLASMLYSMLGEYSMAASLVALFAFIYLTLRIIFDQYVPGYVHVPAGADKAGGGVLGAIAGAYAAGVLLIAAQTLPFGPTILGYARYAMAEPREVRFPIGSNAFMDATVHNEVTGSSLATAERARIFLPVDALVLGTVAHVSDGGSLAGAQPLSRVHPNYLDELFFTRIGIQTSARHTAPAGSISVENVFMLDSIPSQVDSELLQIRRGNQALSQSLTAPEGQTFLVVRTIFSGDTDDNGLVHISPAAVRLVAPDDGAWTNLTPIGTLDDGTRLIVNKPDDFLFVRSGSGADFVFLVEESAVLQDPAATDPTIADGVFIEAKRLAREDLSGHSISRTIDSSSSVAVLRKTAVVPPVPPPAAQGAPQGDAGQQGRRPRGGPPAPGQPSGPPLPPQQGQPPAGAR